MNVASLSSHRVADAKPLDTASTQSTIRIRLHRGRIVWRLVCSIAVVLGSAYALVDQGVHFGTTEHFDLSKIILDQIRTAPHDQQEMMRNTAATARAMTGQWPVWSLVITSLVLIVSIRTFFRELSMVQIADAALVISPKTLTLNLETNRRVLRPIPWSAISAIDERTVRGKPGIVVSLREPARYLAEASVLSRSLIGWHPERIAISAGALSVGRKELSATLQRYFAAHSASSTGD